MKKYLIFLNQIHNFYSKLAGKYKKKISKIFENLRILMMHFSKTPNIDKYGVKYEQNGKIWKNMNFKMLNRDSN